MVPGRRRRYGGDGIVHTRLHHRPKFIGAINLDTLPIETGLFANHQVTAVATLQLRDSGSAPSLVPG